MKTINEFKQYYDEALLPVLETLEEERKKIVRKVKMYGGGMACLGIGIGLGIFMVSGNPSGALLAVALITGISIFGIFWFLTKGFRQQFKQNVVADVVRFFDNSLQYSANSYISEYKFRESGIFESRIDRYNGEDMISGKLEATGFEFSEIHAEYKTEHRDSKGNRQTQWHTIFKGIYFIADFNKDFKSRTVVLPDLAEKAFGFLGKKLQEMNFSRSGELIKLEDPEFEKEFAVYGDDQVEARYILSTALMQRIVEFKRKTNKKIHLGFTRSNVHVAISTAKDHFEPRIFKTLCDFELVREFFEDLQLVVGIINDLNLNTRIWTKE